MLGRQVLKKWTLKTTDCTSTSCMDSFRTLLVPDKAKPEA
jgi:hypothetical protein